MIKSLSMALLLGSVFSFSACAAESSDVPADAEAKVAIAQKTVRAPETAWRDLDPENTLYIDTDYGRFIIELFPEIAPKHVAQIKTLTRQKFYDFITFHRVIDGFMNQTGDPKGDGTGDSSLPDIEAEFTFRRSPDMAVTLIGAQPVDPQNPNSGEIGVGFYKSLPVASQPSSQAILTKDGKVEAYGIHCKGVTSMARSGGQPNSGNSQFFLMRGTSPWLDTQYSIWGNTVGGREHLESIKVGTAGEKPDFVPDKMNKVQVVADVPAAERVNIQVLDTRSPAFNTYLQTQKKTDGSYPDICDIAVPTRIKP